MSTTGLTLDAMVDYALTDPGDRRDIHLLGASEEQIVQLRYYCHFRQQIEIAPVTDRVKIVNRIGRMIERVGAESSPASIAISNEWLALANIALGFVPDEAHA